jgi:predicted sugar kinase
MGAYFAPMQGGPFVSATVAKVLERLAAQGVTGLGQSSWGPTGFAFAASEADGEALLQAARTVPGTASLQFDLVEARNEPARIEAA